MGRGRQAGTALVAMVLAGSAVLAVAGAPPARSQLPVTTSTTRRPTTSTSTPKTTTSAPAPSSSTTAKPRAATTVKPTTTTTEKPTTTIPTPAQTAPSTTTSTPISKHSGHFSPVFTYLAFLGVLAGIGLFVLQWFLTKPGRQGWTL